MAANPNWWNPAWLYRLTITVDHTKVAADMTEMLINITEAHLSNALANGDDILLCKDNNDDQLNHEIESFSQGTGKLVLWVKHDISASVDTLFYLYYGNAASPNQQNVPGTWKPSYKMVQHLQETTGNRIDSTSNTNDGVPTNVTAVEGKIDGAAEFADASVINCGHGVSLDITGAITISAWVKCSYIPIYDVDDLQAINDDLAATYILMNDIDCSVTAGWNGGLGFDPIGQSPYFTGILNGNGYKLTNLHINRPAEDYVGLFGYLTTGSEIRNLTIENATIVGNDHVGGLAGHLRSGVYHIKIVNIDLTGDTCIGGIAGKVKGSIYNSYVTGAVNGTTYVGGMVGTRIGGYKYAFSLRDCWASCSVTGNAHVGGLAGRAEGHSRSKTKFYRSFAIGLITGVTDVGGLAGSCSNITNYNSFWDTQTSGQPTSCIGTGKTTAEMKQQATFTVDPTNPFDFVVVWDIIENVTYPWLRSVPASATEYILVSKGRDAYALEMNQFGTELKGFINSTEINVAITPNIDTFVELKYDGINIRLLVNGIQVASAPLSGAININTTDLIIGNNFIGIIDETKVFDVVETDNWSLTNYNNQNLLAGFLTTQQVDALYFDLKIIDHNAVAIEDSRIVVRDNVNVIVTEEDTLATGSISQQAYINSKTAHAIQAYKYSKEMMPSVLDIAKDLDWTFTLYVDPYITETAEATVAVYTGITIDHIAETIVISENHTLEEIYDYCQYNIISNTQSDILQTMRTGNGVNFTCEYTCIINDGITVSAASKKLTMVAGKTYTLIGTGHFTGIIADQTKTRVPIMLSGVADASRYRIEKSSDHSLIAEGTQSGAGVITNYYEHTVNIDVIIRVRKASAGIKYLVWSGNSTITNTGFLVSISQVEDTIVT